MATIRLLTRQGDDKNYSIFDIPDPNRSPLIEVNNYLSRRQRFYRQVGIEAGVWCVLDEVGFKFEYDLPVEYVLSVDESRVVAYVERCAWTKWVCDDGMQDPSDFTAFSNVRDTYKNPEVLISAPVRPSEVIERRVLATRRIEIWNGTEWALRGSA